MHNELIELLSGEVLEEEVELTMTELCLVCQVPEARVLELVDEGIAEPSGQEPARWRFQGISVRRIHCALRLERDLGVNLAGAALAMDLMDELQQLRERLRRLEG
jgi:chaperone modulatory protein CbpM